MNGDKDEEYYDLMLNSLAGLEDDLGANYAPQEAIILIQRVIEICRNDYRERFQGKKEAKAAGRKNDPK